MATTLYARTGTAAAGFVGELSGFTETTPKSGVSRYVESPVYWWSTSRGSAAALFVDTTSVAGPTSGIEQRYNTVSIGCSCSHPLSADVTISGSISVNVWAYELNKSANAAIGLVIQKVSPAGVATTIGSGINTTELTIGSPGSARSFTIAPTSTTVYKGERLRFMWYFDDSSGATMASGYLLSVTANGPTAAAAGDTYVTFTETISFQSTDPSAATLYLTTTDISADASLPGTEMEMWTSRGSGSTAVTRSAANGPMSPLSFQSSGTDVGWFSKPLQAFTLSGKVTVKYTGGSASQLSYGPWSAVELAVTDGNGGNATVYGYSAGVLLYWTSGGPDYNVTCNLVGRDISVTNGQRLRLRFFLDDADHDAQSGSTVTIHYAGSAGAEGDAYLLLGQSVAEYTGGGATVDSFSIINGGYYP